MQRQEQYESGHLDLHLASVRTGEGGIKSLKYSWTQILWVSRYPIV